MIRLSNEISPPSCDGVSAPADIELVTTSATKTGLRAEALLDEQTQAPNAGEAVERTGFSLMLSTSARRSRSP